MAKSNQNKNNSQKHLTLSTKSLFPSPHPKKDQILFAGSSCFSYSKMFLEKLPKEEGLFKRIYSIDENKEHTRIEVDCSSEIISGMDNYDDWLLAFKEHYDAYTNTESGIKKNYDIQRRGMFIPRDDPKIGFEVDYSHKCLRFWLHDKDEESRSICYKFLERLFN
jgi:hypothetical protein